MTPWSTDVRVDGDEIVVTAMLSLAPGPARAFRPFLDGQLGRVLDRLRRERVATDTAGGPVLAFPSGVDR